MLAQRELPTDRPLPNPGDSAVEALRKLGSHAFVDKGLITAVYPNEYAVDVTTDSGCAWSKVQIPSMGASLSSGAGATFIPEVGYRVQLLFLGDSTTMQFQPIIIGYELVPRSPDDQSKDDPASVGDKGRSYISSCPTVGGHGDSYRGLRENLLPGSWIVRSQLGAKIILHAGGDLQFIPSDSMNMSFMIKEQVLFARSNNLDINYAGGFLRVAMGSSKKVDTQAVFGDRGPTTSGNRVVIDIGEETGLLRLQCKKPGESGATTLSLFIDTDGNATLETEDLTISGKQIQISGDRIDLNP